MYLRSSPEVCYQRLQERGRKEEKPVTLVTLYPIDYLCLCLFWELYKILLFEVVIILASLQEYLQSLHDRYEDWLGNEKHHCWHGNTPVLVCVCVTACGCVYTLEHCVY